MARKNGAARSAFAFAVAAALCGWVAAPAKVAALSPPITIPPAQLPPATPGNAPPSIAPGSPAAGAPNMALLLPTGVQILHDSQGAGLAMYGVVRGGVQSATGALRAVFAYSQAFDPTPTLRLVLADQDDKHAQALFSATVQEISVTGIAVVSLSDSGGDVTVFYDNAGAFAASFPRMRKALSQNGGVDTLVLSPLDLADGARIGLPAGWLVMDQGAGSVELAGPEGEFISLGVATQIYAHSPELGGAVLRSPCCDPKKTYETLFAKLAAAAQRRGFPPQILTRIVETKLDPAPNGGEGALILSDLRVGGKEYGYFAAADSVPGFTDPWTFTLSGTMAPQPVFAAEFPALMQIWNSYRAVHPRFGVNLWFPDAVLGMSATQAMLNATIAARETVEYNASERWDELIHCIDNVASPACGPSQIGKPSPGTLADAFSADTGRPWHVVPEAELK